MKDNIRMDTHKLIYHPEVVANWKMGKNIYPIELEVSLTNACNHRCIFCAVDYIGYKPTMMNKEILLNNLQEIAPKGVKSIIYAGEGEPLLHKDAVEIINKTKKFGIDAAMSTNGVLLTEEVSRDCLKSLTWIRFSTSGIKEDTYEKIHQCKKGDLKKVLINMESAVKVKRDQGLKTTLGVQLLLLPNNQNEVFDMAKELRNIGVDYFTIKPFSQHPLSENKIEIDYSNLLELEEQLKELSTENFRIYFRANAMKKLVCKREYKQCLALPFMVYIDSLGNLWPCIAFMGRDELAYGNLNENRFVDIWKSQRRKDIISYFNNLNLEENCREICRLDEMNKYLDELVHPSDHVNFI